MSLINSIHYSYLEEKTVLICFGVLLFGYLVTGSPDLDESFHFDSRFGWSRQHALVILFFFQCLFRCSPGTVMWFYYSNIRKVSLSNFRLNRKFTIKDGDNLSVSLNITKLPKL